VHPDAEAGRNRRGSDLAGELLPPAEPSEVVDCADDRRDRGTEQDAAHRAAQWQKGERRRDDPEEQREAAQARDAARCRPPAAFGAIDGAEQACHPADRRREEHDDDEGSERTPDDLQVLRQLGPDHGAYFVPYRRSPASPSPGTM
jgi:hypothetical protein